MVLLITNYLIFLHHLQITKKILKQEKNEDYKNQWIKYIVQEDHQQLKKEPDPIFGKVLTGKAVFLLSGCLP
jgi:hypothetical protein